MAFEDFWMSETAAPTGASLRFSAAQSLSRAIAVAGDQNNWSFYTWVKRANSGAINYIFSQQVVTTFTNDGAIGFSSSDNIQANNISNFSGPTAITPGLYRDPGAWYHVGMTFSGGSTLNVYVNGVLAATATAAGGGPINTTLSPMYIGTSPLYGLNLNGYLSDAFFVSGQTLLPTTFGYFDANGIWVPKSFAGAKASVIAAGGFGTNGFALRFESQYFNSGTLVWTDQSGNGNNFTASWNCQTGASGTTDIMTDSPVKSYATANPLGGYANTGNRQQGLTNANLTASGNTLYIFGIPSTLGMSRGKYYAEFVCFVQAAAWMGLVPYDFPTDGTLPGLTPTSYGFRPPDGYIINNSTIIPYTTGFTTTDVIGMAFDADARTLSFYKNGVDQGVAFTGIPAGAYFWEVNDINVNSAAFNINCGQQPFAYAPPAGFEGMSTAAIPAATIPDGSTGFQALLAPGASILSTAQAAFPNGLWWVKDRVNADQFQLVDSLNTSASTFRCPALTTGAYSAPAGDSVAWCWATPASGVNTSTGFSITQGTGNVPHGLGAPPQFAIFRAPSGSTGSLAPNLLVYNVTMGTSLAYALNQTNVAFAANWTVDSTNIGLAEVTSSVTRYCWTPIPGYSSFGAYVGNGNADGPFVYTGFKPAFLLRFNYQASRESVIEVNYPAINPLPAHLLPPLTAPEVALSPTGTGEDQVDWLSNGFKVRSNNIASNFSGNSIAYAAFAENPFGGSNVAPVTAR